MKQLTEYFNESLLDDEEDLIADQSSAIVHSITDWLDTHDPEPEYPKWRGFSPRMMKQILITKNGVELHSKEKSFFPFEIEMKNETNIPKYINFKSINSNPGGNIYIQSDAKKLIVESDQWQNLQHIEITGRNIESIEFKNNISCNNLIVECPNIKTLIMPKGEVLELHLEKCNKMDCWKCKFPNVAVKTAVRADFTERIYDTLGLQHLSVVNW